MFPLVSGNILIFKVLGLFLDWISIDFSVKNRGMTSNQGTLFSRIYCFLRMIDRCIIQVNLLVMYDYELHKLDRHHRTVGNLIAVSPKNYILIQLNCKHD